jgi:hypothetical protein
VPASAAAVMAACNTGSLSEATHDGTADMSVTRLSGFDQPRSQTRSFKVGKSPD